MNVKMSDREVKSAKIAAAMAVDAERRGDTIARNRALSELFGAAGYWRQSRGPLSTAEFRGNVIPPKMLRMPRGRSVPWAQRFAAAEAWAKA